MTRCVRQPKAKFTLSRPKGLDSKTWKYIGPVVTAWRQAQGETGRFKYYPYLVEVYRTYKEWKSLRVSKRMTHRTATHFKTPKGKTPIRTLLDATSSNLDSKRKSRWSRALELAVLAKATPEQLTGLFKNYSGIAGCARMAAQQKPKKKRDDWAQNKQSAVG
jgi:hypothetical protein